jgi:organic radical activating enzyme
MKQARLIIDLGCNMECSYCCNKLPDQMKQFIPITLGEFVNKSYDTVQITGGEPTLDMNKLVHILTLLTNVKRVFLWTNGFRYKDVYIKLRDWCLIRGLNYSIHDKYYNIDDVIGLSEAFGPFFRLHISEHLNAELINNRAWELVKTTLTNNFSPLKVWKLNDCDVPSEDRFILSEY